MRGPALIRPFRFRGQRSRARDGSAGSPGSGLIAVSGGVVLAYTRFWWPTRLTREERAQSGEALGQDGRGMGAVEGGHTGTRPRRPNPEERCTSWSTSSSLRLTRTPPDGSPVGSYGVLRGTNPSAPMPSVDGGDFGTPEHDQ